MYIDSGNCVPICSGTQIPINSICSPCNSACQTCASFTTNCILCSTGYFFTYQNNSFPNCRPNCASGYIYNNTVGTGNIECLTSCPANFYAISLNSQCQPCSIGCSICTGSSNNCSLCLTSYYLDISTTTCTQNCPINAPFPTTYTSPSVSYIC